VLGESLKDWLEIWKDYYPTQFLMLSLSGLAWFYLIWY
jgi:hypothetical protein